MYKVSNNYDFIEFPKNEPKCSERHNYFHLLVLDEFGYRIVDGEWYEKADRFHKIPKQFYTLECGIDVIENVVGFCERPTLDVQHINDFIFENRSNISEDVSKAVERLKTALDFFKKDKNGKH